MNLWDRIGSGLLISTILILFGCEVSDEGLAIDIPSNTKVAYTEFNLNTTDLLLDSLRTDDRSTPLALAGRYEDDLLGTAEAKAFFQYRFLSGAIVSDTLSLDSLVFSLRVEQVLKNNENAIDRFLLYNLEDRLFNEVVYLSDFEAEIAPDPVDTLFMNVIQDGGLTKNLLDSFGNYLIDFLSANDSISIGFSAGIGILPMDETANLVSLDMLSDSTFFNLYTSDSQNSYVTRFGFDAYFTNLERDRTNSVIQGKKNLDTLMISPDYSLISPLFGVSTLVNLKPLIDFGNANDNIIINKAELISDLNVSEKIPLSGIRYYFHDTQFGIRGEGLFRNAVGTLVLTNDAYLTGQRQILVGRYDSTEYSNDITLFTEIFLNDLVDDNVSFAEKLVLISNNPLDLRETRIQQNKVKIRIYYTTLN